MVRLQRSVKGESIEVKLRVRMKRPVDGESVSRYVQRPVEGKKVLVSEG
jgi:hypothetical protein